MKCVDCRFGSDEKTKEIFSYLLECRVNPPVFSSAPKSGHDFNDEDTMAAAAAVTKFPVVDENDWCGKFEPK